MAVMTDGRTRSVRCNEFAADMPSPYPARLANAERIACPPSMQPTTQLRPKMLRHPGSAASRRGGSHPRPPAARHPAAHVLAEARPRAHTRAAGARQWKQFEIIPWIRESVETFESAQEARAVPIKGAGKETAPGRPIATIVQVDAVADARGPRWRLMVRIAAHGPPRPEELAEMRRHDVDLERAGVRVRRAAPELTNGRRVLGETRPKPGSRFIVLPDVLRKEPDRDLRWYAEKGRTDCRSWVSAALPSGAPPSGGNGVRPARRPARRLTSGSRVPEEVRTQQKPQVIDLGFPCGAGDENRTRALSLGSSCSTIKLRPHLTARHGSPDQAPLYPIRGAARGMA